MQPKDLNLIVFIAQYSGLEYSHSCGDAEDAKNDEATLAVFEHKTNHRLMVYVDVRHREVHYSYTEAPDYAFSIDCGGPLFWQALQHECHRTGYELVEYRYKEPEFIITKKKTTKKKTTKKKTTKKKTIKKKTTKKKTTKKKK